jgi:hypothetical protein
MSIQRRTGTLSATPWPSRDTMLPRPSKRDTEACVAE